DYIFTEKIVMDTQIVYILDGQPIESEDFSAIGTTDSVGEVELGVYKSGVAASTGLIMDPEWGNYVTGFAPIWDVENNEIIGLVGVDHSAEYIIEFMKKVDFTLVLLFCILTSLLSSLSVILITQHAKQLRKDFLTGLNNRRAFDAMLVAMIKRYDRKKIKFSILMIDVDKFKQINDTYGHVVGDLVLKWVAEHISIGIIDENFIFRFGGDEFVIILPEHSEEEAAFIAKQLQDEFLGNHLYIAKEQPIILEISVGIAEYHENSSIETFLNEADENMYKIKTGK
ncbi:MAG: GGDEF domain-containing protein, partial [Anaerotignum sp.]